MTITPNEIIELIESLPDVQDHIFSLEDKDRIMVTDEWLVGCFASMGFVATTKEDAAQQLIDYLNRHIGHDSMVGRIVTDSGWPNLSSVRTYCRTGEGDAEEE